MPAMQKKGRYNKRTLSSTEISQRPKFTTKAKSMMPARPQLQLPGPTSSPLMLPDYTGMKTPKVWSPAKSQEVVRGASKISNRLIEQTRGIADKGKKIWGSKYGKAARGGGRAVARSMGRYGAVGKSVRGAGKLIKGVSKIPGAKFGLMAVGAVGMLAMSVSKGLMNQSREVVFDRYMKDQRYSRNMLHNSRVGLASGTNSMLNKGSVNNLSSSLSRTRHGRY